MINNYSLSLAVDGYSSLQLSSNLGSVHQVPINGWVEEGSMELISLMDTCKHDKQWETNPDLLILSPTLSTATCSHDEYLPEYLV